MHLLTEPSKEDKLDSLQEHYRFMILSPECYWKKTQALLTGLLDSEAFERTWQKLDKEAKNWRVGEGVFLSEILTDFGAQPTAAALSALTTTLRLVTEPNLQKRAETAAERWWTRLRKSMWGHGIETTGNRFHILQTLDQGAVLLSESHDNWVKAYHHYFTESLIKKLKDPKRYGHESGGFELEALLRLSPIGGVISQEILSLLTEENRELLAYPTIQILQTHRLDKDTLARLKSHEICNLPTHRFRLHIRDISSFKHSGKGTVYDVGAMYTLNILVRREPILALMKNPDQSFTIQELSEKIDQNPEETQLVVGHLVKSGLASFDSSRESSEPWHSTETRFHLTKYGAILAALA